MEIGVHNCKVLSHYFEDKDSGAACCAIKCQFDNGETDYGRIWMAKKGGEVIEKNVETVRKLFGWETDNPLDLNACKYDNLVVSVTVEMETTQNGREVPRITWINTPRKVMDEASANAMAARWKGKFASSAKVLSVKPLSAVTPTATPVAASAVTKEKKDDHGVITLAKFNEVFSDRTQEVRNLLWNTLLNGVIPGVDTASASRDQWLAVYKAIPALRKQVEEQDKAQDEVPF